MAAWTVASSALSVTLTGEIEGRLTLSCSIAAECSGGTEHAKGHGEGQLILFGESTPQLVSFRHGRPVILEDKMIGQACHKSMAASEFGGSVAG